MTDQVYEPNPASPLAQLLVVLAIAGMLAATVSTLARSSKTASPRWVPALRIVGPLALSVLCAVLFGVRFALAPLDADLRAEIDSALTSPWWLAVLLGLAWIARRELRMARNGAGVWSEMRRRWQSLGRADDARAVLRLERPGGVLATSATTLIVALVPPNLGASDAQALTLGVLAGGIALLLTRVPPRAYAYACVVLGAAAVAGALALLGAPSASAGVAVVPTALALVAPGKPST